MRKGVDLLRSVVREVICESLSKDDVALSKLGAIPDVVDSHGMGRRVRVELNGKTWLTGSQSEVRRVLSLGGKIVTRNGQPVRENA